MTRIAQLSDIHLVEEPYGSVRGVNTEQRFQACLEDLKNQTEQPDLIILSGDLSQDGSVESYQRIADAMQSLTIPCYWLQGNHDIPAHMNDILKGSNLHAEKAIFPNDSWQIVLLDSTQPGLVRGRFMESELDFLNDFCKQDTERNTLIVCHHQVLEFGHQSLDNIGIDNNDDFWDIVKQYDHVKAIAFGHLHYGLELKMDGVDILATPSCTIKGKTLKESDYLFDEDPGYRYIELNKDGTITTQVISLDI
jgi:3',5'-cyclic-AMP phosphodiesterase